MAKTKKTPELRFKGFTDAWEELRYQDVAELRRGLTYKPSDIATNGIRVLRSSNVDEDTFAFQQDDVFVSEKAINIEYVQPNDILITSANGSSRLVGKHAIIPALGEKAVHGGFMLLSKAKDPFFLNASMSSRWFDDFIKLHVSGGNGAIGNLSKSDLENQGVLIPSEKEQSKIGTFFQNLDSLIALRRRKLDKLVAVKKAMLVKMFPKEGEEVPELRFKGFAGKWERRRIGGILTETKRPIELADSKKYELITVKRRNEGIVSRGMLKGKDILVKNYFEIRAGDFVISKRQIVHGANGIVPQNLDMAIVSNEYLVVTGNDNITTEFWTVMSKLPNMHKKFFLSSYGVDIEKLVFDVDDWRKRNIYLPVLTEQNRIVEFFQRIDSLIALQRRELDTLKNLKKAFLEKMFV